MNAFEEKIGIARAAYHAREFDKAAEAFKSALDYDAQNLIVLFGLGNSLLEAGRNEEALAPLEKAVALSPQNPDVRNSLGIAFRRLKRFEEAIPHLKAAAEAYPDNAGIVTNLANAYRSDHRLPEALETYKRALAKDQKFTEACFGLGTAYRMAGDLTKASEMLDRALTLDPKHADARFSRALVYLEQGNFTFGFADYEHRWSSSDFPGRSIAGREWRGEDVNGKAVLVHAEQGYGDTIQFARYIPMLAAQGAEVLFYVQPDLASVFADLDGVAKIIPAETPPPAYDFYVAVMSLPYHFGTIPESIPASIPYLSAPTDLSKELDALLPANADKMRVGLVWAGRPTHSDDRRRSCRLADLQSLLDTDGVEFFSLQKETRAEDAEHLADLVDLGPHLSDFGQTAAAMQRLDLIISVDTAPAHLAGALGRPVWLLLAHRAEWRWSLEAETTPWYPSMRLARQPEPGGWPSVIERLQQGLRQHLHRTA